MLPSTRRAMLHSLRLLLPALVLLAVAPAPASAQQVELGAWGAFSRSSEITTDIYICTMDGCSPSAMMPHRSVHAPAVGVTGRVALHPRVALRGELALVPKGYPPPTHPYVTSTYLEAPLALEVAWLRLGRVDLTAAGGVAPALLLACTVSARTVDGFRQTGCQEEWHGQILGPRDRDLGVLLAVGARLRGEGGAAFVELRRVHGVVDTNPHAYGRTLNRTLALLAGYAVVIGRR